MSAGKYEHEFRWESSVPDSVIVTGTFDDWKSTLHLTKLGSGKFSGKVPLEYGSKVLYKYVVDGNWQANSSEPTETDGSGNTNNVLNVPERPAAPTVEEPKAAAAGSAEVNGTPAATSLSNVVSAMAGAAAAGSAAAFAAVTGKDLLAGSSSDEVGDKAGKKVEEAVSAATGETAKPAGAPVSSGPAPTSAPAKVPEPGAELAPVAPETAVKEAEVTRSTNGTAPKSNEAAAPTAQPAAPKATEPAASLKNAADEADKGYLEAAAGTVAGAAIAAGLISTETGKSLETQAKTLDAKVEEVAENAKKAAEAEKTDQVKGLGLNQGKAPTSAGAEDKVVKGSKTVESAVPLNAASADSKQTPEPTQEIKQEASKPNGATPLTEAGAAAAAAVGGAAAATVAGKDKAEPAKTQETKVVDAEPAKGATPAAATVPAPKDAPTVYPADGKPVAVEAKKPAEAAESSKLSAPNATPSAPQATPSKTPVKSSSAAKGDAFTTPAKGGPKTPKSTLRGKGVPGTPAAEGTPAEDYKTAPSTPQGTPSKDNRRRKSSLFHKIKTALSPGKSAKSSDHSKGSSGAETSSS